MILDDLYYWCEVKKDENKINYYPFVKDHQTYQY